MFQDVISFVFVLCSQVSPAVDHRRYSNEQRQTGFDRQQLDDDDVYREQRAGRRVAVELVSKSHVERSPRKSRLKKKN